MAEDIVTVFIGNEKVTGFERVEIHKSLETLSGYFEIVMTDLPEGNKNFKLKTQADCTIKLGNDTVLTGFIDNVTPHITKNTHTVLIRGREKTADLVDCSIHSPPLEYPANSDLTTLAKNWCAPFLITVVKDYDSETKFTKRFCVSHGETVAEALIRACKLKGVIPVTDTLGRLVLTASGGAISSDKLEWGFNVEEAEADFDFTNRFSKYTYRTQTAGGDQVIATLWGKSLDVRGVAVDKDVRRYRPLVLNGDSTFTATDCKKRAQVEALVRAANSQYATVTLAKWRQSDGKLWVPNLIIPCDIPSLYINQELLSSTVTYVLDENGSSVQMKLVRPDAFNPGTKFKVKRRSGDASSEGTLKKQKNLGFGF